MSTVIKVENISKQYRLGQVGTGSLAHDVNRFWHRVRGKEDPYLKIGEENERSVKGKSDYVWALKDINFEVQQGEVLGIIGRNGAGKSTLLKILSRTTTPTTGKVKIKGRVASLLEVGTGFHPELSGRENIFLNGAILGMTKNEIKSKFDEIVDFSGVQRYIDTPVKRYSSGMYVRLAFAVAANLEPDILIVDEVLAVGDAEFQKKAMGKMKDVSTQEGRTVLFVSHNMGAIQSLCKTGLFLKNGQIVAYGKVEKILETYVNSAPQNGVKYSRRRGNENAIFLEYGLVNENGIHRREFFMGDSIFIYFKIRFNQNIRNAEIGVNIKNGLGEIVTHITNLDNEFAIFGEQNDVQNFLIELPNVCFSPNLYTMDIAIVSGEEHFDMLEDVLSFSMIEGKKIKRGRFPSHVKVFVQSAWQRV
ncbi:MAG: ABC transporter ATP-binding protein [Bacteroidota bacterium]|nr:ABC transporter ATP-binding protein [Bacteroidota bacterium]